ncbi:MAG: F420-0--gamma-glutamyl ligase [Oscillospiraceae bacterium]|nr:F420-0--gamma-glutamyl ligase [Oscillospiraceae bacterium]
MSDSRNNPESRREENGIAYYERCDVVHDGVTYQRLAVQTHFVERGESYIELVEHYIAPLLQDGDMLSISEKIISMCQNNVVERKDIKIGFWAKLLARFASSNKHGPGVSEPPKMQLAIDLAGLPRILWATICSAAGKLFGKRGLFYKIAGHGIDGIDGLYPQSDFAAYREMALLNPREPDKVCAEVEAILGVPVMLVDANDLTVTIFGKSPSMALSDADLCAIIKDNPAGQNDELTPLILIRCGEAA